MSYCHTRSDSVRYLGCRSLLTKNGTFMTPKPAFGMRVVICGSMRKDILWPAATCIAVALAMAAAVSLGGQHGKAEGGGKLGEAWEALRSEERRVGEESRS